MVESDLDCDDEILDLVRFLFWHPDDRYYLFFPYSEGISDNLAASLGRFGVSLRMTEMYFFRHPAPAYENDFVRILPQDDIHDWQRLAAKCRMFGRITLTLECWKRKQIEFRELARITAAEIAENEDVLEAKPNLMGFGINLNSGWRKSKRWIPRRLKTFWFNIIRELNRSRRLR